MVSSQIIVISSQNNVQNYRTKGHEQVLNKLVPIKVFVIPAVLPLRVPERAEGLKIKEGDNWLCRPWYICKFIFKNFVFFIFRYAKHHRTNWHECFRKRITSLLKLLNLSQRCINWIVELISSDNIECSSDPQILSQNRNVCSLSEYRLQIG